MTTMADRLLFIAQWLRHPFSVAARGVREQDLMLVENNPEMADRLK